jgi:hypothetical protein
VDFGLVAILLNVIIVVGGGVVAVMAARKSTTASVWEGNYKAEKARGDGLESSLEESRARFAEATAQLAEVSARPDYSQVRELLQTMFEQLSSHQEKMLNVLTVESEKQARLMVTEIASQIGTAASGAIAGVVAASSTEHQAIVDELKKMTKVLEAMRKEAVNGRTS